MPGGVLILALLVAPGPAYAASRPTIKLTPAATGPIRATIKVSVTGCPKGSITIKDSLNGGTQKIRGNRAPAAVISKGKPAKYAIVATCSNGATARAVFVVDSIRPKVKLNPTSSGPVTATIDVSVTGCPAGPIRITDTINGGSQRIRGIVRRQPSFLKARPESIR